MDYKELIAEKIKIDGIEKSEIYEAISIPTDSKMGDYCIPCFKFSKQLKKSPALIAEDLKRSISSCKEIESVEVVSAYLNIKLFREGIAKETLENILARGSTFLDRESNKKTICIDYSSINIAKPLHIGHLLSTAIGGSLYRIYKYLGFNVVGINHLGDYGTQFGKLITAYKLWSSAERVEKNGINELLNIYQKFHIEAEKDDTLNEVARQWFKKIEDKDEEALSIFTRFKEITLKEVMKTYELLDVKFDSFDGESFFSDKMKPVIDGLESKGILTESEGAKIVDLSEFNMPPCLIQRSDGASLYATRDLSAVIYRKNTYNFDKCLYVVAYQQNLHFQQFFKVLELMGYEWAKDCIHVAFGMVSLEGAGSLSTRSGNVVFLQDVINTAIQKATDIIDTKSPNLINKEEIARQVGVGAVVFGALYNAKIKDLVFSFDKALNFDGETAPYLQYTHARCNSILEKASAEGLNAEIDYSSLCDDETYAILKLLSRFDETVELSAQKCEPSVISRYLIDLAQSFNKFYISHKVIGDYSRIKLTECVKNVLKNGLRLILINAPDKM